MACAVVVICPGAVGSWPSSSCSWSSAPWIISANVPSPIQPRSRLHTVTPSCVPEMKRVGFSLARWTRRAARLPDVAIWSMRVERDDTSANSVATKNPFAAIRTTTMSRPTRRGTLHAGSCGFVAFAQQVNDRRCNRQDHDQRDDVLEILARIGDQTAEEVTQPGHTHSPDHRADGRKQHESAVRHG